MKPYYLTGICKCWGASLHGMKYWDIADNQAAVVPSRLGKIRKRKWKRRLLNKKARKLNKKIIQDE
jgi:hypothetical protein